MQTSPALHRQLMVMWFPQRAGQLHCTDDVSLWNVESATIHLVSTQQALYMKQLIIILDGIISNTWKLGFIVVFNIYIFIYGQNIHLRAHLKQIGEFNFELFHHVIDIHSSIWMEKRVNVFFFCVFFLFFPVLLIWGYYHMKSFSVWCERTVTGTDCADSLESSIWSLGPFTRPWCYCG